MVEHELSWGALHLHYAEQELAPQSAATFGPFHLFVGAGRFGVMYVAPGSG
ncbi:MAG: hypothetical protein HC802_02915 [Caldilineaceae bacterium]|nr:hypothetical protein [Caldilineaceae bacterium]